MKAPLARKLTQAVSRDLRSAGFAVTVLDSESPPAQAVLAGVEGNQADARHELAIAAGAHASLIAQLSERSGELVLKGDLAGAVSRRSAPFEVTVPVAADEDGSVNRLAGAAAAQTSQLWSTAGADREGRRAGARDRYEAGLAALGNEQVDLARSEFEAATAGDPGRLEYLRAAARADAAAGYHESALARLRAAANLAPEDRDIRLDQGEEALLVGRAEEAERAFRAAAAADASDLRAMEGLARATRAQGRFETARGHYRDLIARLPGIPRTLAEAGFPDPASEAEAIAGMLAGRPDDSIRLATVEDVEIGRSLGLLYLVMGDASKGLRVLFADHGQASRPPYSDSDYAMVSAAADGEAALVAREAQMAVAAQTLGEISEEEAGNRLEVLHNRSEAIATLGESIAVSQQTEPAHLYRALAYNLLNQSGFEALLYARTRDAEHQRRADLLRGFYRKAQQQATELGAALLEQEAPE